MKILFDSDFLFGLFVPDDAHHSKAKKIWKELIGGENEFYVSSLVIQETATVLSYKRGQQTAMLFLEKLPELNLRKIFFEDRLEKVSWDFFKKQKKKGTSFVDCSNLAICKNFNLDKILSFDEFYTNEVGVV